MESSRLTLIALMWVLVSSQKRISGAEVEMRVRPGDNVIIYSDCDTDSRSNAAWFMIPSGGGPTRPLITPKEAIFDPRYSLVWNPIKKRNDLLIKNVTESDQGIYYCIGIKNQDVPSFGRRSTRLIILEESPPPMREPCEPVSQVTPRVETPPSLMEPCVPCTGENGSSGWSCSWQLLVSVSSGCVLLSSLFSSIGVYYLCRKNLKAEVRADRGGKDKRPNLRSDEVEEGEVCYSSLDFQNIKKKKQKQRVQHSDFSTYSEVRTQRT